MRSIFLTLSIFYTFLLFFLFSSTVNAQYCSGGAPTGCNKVTRCTPSGCNEGEFGCDCSNRVCPSNCGQAREFCSDYTSQSSCNSGGTGAWECIGGGGSCYWVPPVTPTPTPRPALRYGCSVNNTCVYQANGLYTSPNCNNKCGTEAKYGCTSDGQCVPKTDGAYGPGCNGTCQATQGYGCVGNSCVQGQGTMNSSCGSGCGAQEACNPPFSDWVCCPGGGYVPAGNEQNCTGGGGGCSHDSDFVNAKTTYVRFISNENGVMKAWRGSGNSTSSWGPGTKNKDGQDMGDFLFNPSDTPNAPGDRNIVDTRMFVTTNILSRGDAPQDPWFGSIVRDSGSIQEEMYNFGWWRIEPDRLNQERAIEILKPQDYNSWTPLMDSNGTIVGWNVKIRQVSGLHRTTQEYNCADYRYDSTPANPCIRDISMLIQQPEGKVSNLLTEAWAFQLYRDNCGDTVDDCSGGTMCRRYVATAHAWSQTWWGSFPNGSSQWRTELESLLNNARNNPGDGWDLTTWNNGMTIDNYWSLSFSYYTMYKGVEKTPVLIVTPPAGKKCGKAFRYGHGSGKGYSEVQNLSDGTCSITSIDNAMVFVELIEDEAAIYQRCVVTADGRSEITINTAKRTDSATFGARAAVTLDSIATDTSNPLAGTARLWFIRTNPNVPYSGSLPVPDGFLGTSSIQFTKLAGGGGSPLHNTTVKSVGGSNTTLPNPPFLGYRNAFFNTTADKNGTNENPRVLEPGTYYAYCDMPYGNTSCSGNPRCTQEGGTIACTPAKSCSEPGSGFLEEIAMRNNLVKYRMLPLDGDGKVSSYPEWFDGPFSVANSITAQGGIVLSLGTYDANNKVHVFMWTKYPNAAVNPVRLNYFIVSKTADGLPNWEEITNRTSTPTQFTPSGANYTSGANAPLAGGLEPTTHDFILTPQGNLLESIWLTSASGQTIGRMRTVPLNSGDGSPNFTTATSWSPNNSLGTTTNPALTFGTALVPTLTPNDPRVFQGYTLQTGTVATQWRRDVLWSAAGTNPTFSNSEGVTYVNKIFGTGQAIDGYSALYIQTGINDKVKISVQCLSSYGVCSAAGVDSCGVNRAAGALAGLGSVAGVTVTPSASAPPLSNKVTVSWNATNKAETYDVVAWPDDGRFADPDAAFDIAAHAMTGKGLTTTSYELDLNFPPFRSCTGSGANIVCTAPSAKIRVAVRAVNVCGPGAWTQLNAGVGSNTTPPTVRLTSPISFRFREVSGPACTGGGALNNTISPSGIRVGVNSSGASTFAISSTSPSNQADTVVHDAEKNSEHDTKPVWYAPLDWFTTGFYSLNPNSSDLINSNYLLACTSTIGGLNAPAANEPVTIYLRPAFDPWWQARGGSSRAAGYAASATRGGDVTTQIPRDCTEPGCRPYVIAAQPSTGFSYTAGIPIAADAVVNKKAGASGTQANTQSGTSSTPKTSLKAEASGLSTAPYAFADIQRNLMNMLAANDEATSFGAYGTGNPITITDLPALLTTSRRITYVGKTYYIIQVTAAQVILNVPDAGWNLNTNNVILLINGNLEIRGTGSTAATNKTIRHADSGYFLVAASGDIEIQNTIGRPPNTVLSSGTPDDASNIYSLRGVYMAGGTLSITGDGSSSTADSQFIGRGSFIGLQGVTLGRNFQGTYPPASITNDLRYLNNTNPSEIFMYDSRVITNSPSFINEGILSYSEKN